jgi:Rrf2 family protein
MIGLSRKSDYALVALAHLAQEAAGRDAPVSARQVAEVYGLPVPQMMGLMKQLHRAGLTGSTRGAAGGYYLTRPVERISVLDVIEAIEGPVQMAICCGGEELSLPNADGAACLACQLEARCPVTTAVRELNGRVVELLRRTTLQDLIETAASKNPRRQATAATA